MIAVDLGVVERLAAQRLIPDWKVNREKGAHRAVVVPS